MQRSEAFLDVVISAHFIKKKAKKWQYIDSYLRKIRKNAFFQNVTNLKNY